MLRLFAAALAVALGLIVPSIAIAETPFPDHRIDVVLPYPGGGIVDILTRIITDVMSRRWKQPIVVEPKPGANGSLAWDLVARAPADGYTWTFLSPGVIANPRMQSGLRWSEKDFVVVGAAAWAPSVVVVSPDLPVRTMRDLIDYARKNPHVLNWANPGVGTSLHLNTAILINSEKLDMVEVAYKGQPPALLDLMAGRIQLAVSSIGLVAGHIKTGALRALAVVGKTRSPLLPDVPTLTEAGFPEMNVVPWYGFAAPRGTPPAVVDAIVTAVNAAIADPTVRTAIEAQGMQPVTPMTSAELAALLATDTQHYAKVITDANLRADK